MVGGKANQDREALRQGLHPDGGMVTEASSLRCDGPLIAAGCADYGSASRQK